MYRGQISKLDDETYDKLMEYEDEKKLKNDGSITFENKIVIK